jgi:hypothetical protein
VDKTWVEENWFHLQELWWLIQVKNADGSVNWGGDIKHKSQFNVQVGNHIETRWFNVVDLRKVPHMILGLLWLNMHNLEIDWVKQTVSFMQCDQAHQLDSQKPIRMVSSVPPGLEREKTFRLAGESQSGEFQLLQKGPEQKRRSVEIEEVEDEFWTRARLEDRVRRAVPVD